MQKTDGLIEAVKVAPTASVTVMSYSISSWAYLGTLIYTLVGRV